MFDETISAPPPKPRRRVGRLLLVLALLLMVWLAVQWQASPIEIVVNGSSLGDTEPWLLVLLALIGIGTGLVLGTMLLMTVLLGVGLILLLLAICVIAALGAATLPLMLPVLLLGATLYWLLRRRA